MVARPQHGRLTPSACLCAGWLLVFATAGFLWSAMRQTPDWEGAAADAAEPNSQHLHPTLKPAYCKPELPGCVPKDISYVFWISSPESAQDVVEGFIQSHSTPNSTGMQLAGCNLAGAFGEATHCFSATGDHHSPDVRDKACRAQQVALGLLHQQPMFERLRCNFAMGQYDFSLLYSLPKDILERTLIVLTVRDPVQQTAAIHRVFCQLDPGRMCPGIVPSGTIDPSNCTRVSDFARRGFAGAHPAGALVKRLAGDYCCYQTEPFADDISRMQAAFMNLLRVGVVVDSADASSGLQYMAHVLGWRTQPFDATLASGMLEGVQADEEQKLKDLLQNDYALYRVLQERVLEQVAFLSPMEAEH